MPLRRRELTDTENTVLDAVKHCQAEWGQAKTTIDDIARESKISRATIYRMFPGGKDVLFDALRVRELNEFFTVLRDAVAACDTLEDVLVSAVVAATAELRADEHLAAMLSTEPGEALDQLTVEGLPRILRAAKITLVPLLRGYIDDATADGVVDLLARLTISYFLAPSELIDLGDPESARSLIRPMLRSVVPETAIQSTSSKGDTHVNY